MQSPHIFLVGMMGSGKSTIGKMLAERLAVPFLDLDTEIEARTKQSIAKLFADRGEFEFRTCEAQMLRELPSRHPRSVIATGGGAPAYFDSMTFMNATGLTVYLEVGTRDLLARLEAEREARPLLADPHWQETVELLIRQRESNYRQAKVIVGTGEQTPEETLGALLQHGVVVGEPYARG